MGVEPAVDSTTTPEVGGSKLRAYFELCRLPNCFTAMADPLAGALAAGAGWREAHRVAAVMLAGGFLYAGGIALNDWYDHKRDLAERPSRPIPSRRVYPLEALIIAAVLLGAGVGFGSLGGQIAGRVAIVLFVAIILYDVILKEVPVAPVIMGSCRALNLLMGLSLVPATSGSNAPMAMRVCFLGVMAAYVTGLTFFARKETGGINPRRLTVAAITAISPLLVLASLAFIVPQQVRYWHGEIFGAALLMAVGFYMTRAVLTPEPANVQRAVKAAVMGIIVLDAAIVGYMCPLPASVGVLLLLIPALVLGRWMYST